MDPVDNNLIRMVFCDFPGMLDARLTARLLTPTANAIDILEFKTVNAVATG